MSLKRIGNQTINPSIISGPGVWILRSCGVRTWSLQHTVIKCKPRLALSYCAFLKVGRVPFDLQTNSAKLVFVDKLLYIEPKSISKVNPIQLKMTPAY